MLRDTAVARIQDKLGFRSDKSSNIVALLQDAQRELEKGIGEGSVLPWWLLTEIATKSTIVGEERLLVPDDMLREYEQGCLYRFDTNAELDEQWVCLVKDDYEAIKVAPATAGTGAPTHYALVGKYFRLRPTPDAIYPIKMLYYKKDFVLTSNIENVWLLREPDLLIGWAGSEMAEDLRDTRAKEFFEGKFAAASARALRTELARETTNRRYVMGGPD